MTMISTKIDDVDVADSTPAVRKDRKSDWPVLRRSASRPAIDLPPARLLPDGGSPAANDRESAGVWIDLCGPCAEPFPLP